MVRRSLVGLLGALAGCYSPAPQAGSPCPTGVCPHGLVCSPLTQTCEHEDATTDAGPLADADAGLAGCYGVGLVVVCPLAPITGQQQLVISTAQAIDTTTSTTCVPYRNPDGSDGTAYCVVAAKTITITTAGRLTATGAKPLVVLGANAILIDGTLDVSSRRTGAPGAGANPTACGPGPTTTGTQGGAGGSFGSAGGSGGRGLGDATPAPAAPATTAITALRGGCRGANGAGALPGAGGNGGGAVYLISRDSIFVGGTINASGAGGTGASLDGGGGGGGAGGMIGLDAPMVAVGGRVFANGGGGGEGGGGNSGLPGEDPTLPLEPAVGGAGGAGGGGDGGSGAMRTEPARNGDSDSAAGGGGGGGFGVIVVFPPRPLGGSISPTPS